jgi:endothelin-converting enzyme
MILPVGAICYAIWYSFNADWSYVDGGWLNAHPLPADKSSFGSFDALAQKNKQVIQKILESESYVASVDDEILLKLRNLYASCLDERGLDEIGTTVIRSILKKDQSERLTKRSWNDYY